MDIKTLSAMICHVSAETTLNIYSHITDTMQQQAAVRIDREIGGTNAEMPEPTPPKASAEPSQENATEAVFEPYKGKIRKPARGVSIRSTRTFGKEASIRECPMASGRNSTSTPKQEQNAKSYSKK